MIVDTMTRENIYYYSKNTLSVFTSNYNRLIGQGNAVDYFYQSVLYSDSDLTIPVGQIQWTIMTYFINETVQKHIENMYILLNDDGYITTTCIDNELYYPADQPILFDIVSKKGSLRCAKKTIITASQDGTRTVRIMF